MSSVQDRAREDARYRILRLIEEKPSISQRELSQHVGISVGAINYVLKAFVDKGLVKLGNFSASKHKHRYAYILTPKGVAEKGSLTRRFLERKVAEYEALKAEIEALEAEVGRSANLEIDGNSKND
ncbi:MarR family EPS-associated transcriptional regulator [Thioclava sp. UBA3469]|uniref:MarR family EPS-associated transcriptional regulator n=1 Tax=Thioclava sp. UBA3469 TaxID=1947693 RepID=UPI000C4CF327|nr:MarR family EPS-associated transcriptional regulator [Thioclava sp. UBA3469]MAQ36049.1 MarR family EPS-associated transcriptional regulator [Thioclava sp.]